MSDSTKTYLKLGKYTLREHIATGGMAEIWLAEHIGPGGFNKQLVIKRILPHFAEDAQFTTMFLDEARLVAQLTHPHIAQIYDLGVVDEAYYLAMEYVAGLDVAELVHMLRKRGEYLPLAVALRVISDVLQALDYAHDFTDREGEALGVVHRDVSPHNVIVSNDGIVKLIDFGVAKARDNSGKTQTGAVKGKFAYMAPEQIENRSVDRRADIFACGVMLYEMLAGVRPFGDELQAVANILSKEPQPLANYRSDLPASIPPLISRALAKDPHQRYPTADAMLAEVEQACLASGARLSSRELAHFVRGLQGLPVAETGRAASAVVPPSGWVSPADQSQPFVAPETNPGRQPQTRPGQQSVSSPVSQSEAVNAISTEDRSTTLLIAGFVFAVLGVLGATALIFYLFVVDGEGEPSVNIDPSTASGPEVAVEKRPQERDPQVNRRALRHQDGRMVLIASQPPSKVFYQNEFIGTTPLSTTLRKGKYPLEFQAQDQEPVRRVLVVKEGMGTQAAKFDLSPDTTD